MTTKIQLGNGQRIWRNVGREYKQKQKARAIKLQVDKLENDKAIYKKMGNQEMVDKTDAKLKKLNEKYKEIKSSYK